MNINNTTNALSVDVEDYYHVAAFSSVINRENWGDYDSRVYKNTMELLDLFDTAKVKSTFFVLGMVAEKHPEIIREITKRNHEVACHGYSHQMVTKQSEQVFREETAKAKSIIEDQAQTEVVGYRAASFSITKKTLWALDVLAESGFKYDSSIFPVRHDRYGIPDAPLEPYKIETNNGASIVEFPMTVKKIARVNIPASGGGYFRIYPYYLTKYLLNSINKKDNRPFVFYLHPWEIDHNQPRISAGLFSSFRHYTNLDKCKPRLTRLVDDFSFASIKDTLSNLELL